MRIWSWLTGPKENTSQGEELVVAVRERDEARLLELISAGVNPDTRGEEKATALFTASFRGHAELVRLLLEAGACPSLGAGDGGARPLGAAAQGGHEEVVQLLIDAGADVDSNDHGVRPLHLAALNGHAGCVRTLIEAGGNVNCVMNQGGTPLDLALQGGHRMIAEQLMAAGAQPSQ